MNVFVTSCGNEPDVGGDPDRGKEQKLRLLYEKSMPRLHTLVEDPAAADIILVCNLRDENHYSLVRQSKFIQAHTSNCFGISDLDYPVPLIHGIYTSARKSVFNFGRIRSGGYALHFWQNPFVEASSQQLHTAEKKYLFSFVGGMSHPIRRKIITTYSSQADVYVKKSEGYLFSGNGEVGQSEKEA